MRRRGTPRLDEAGLEALGEDVAETTVATVEPAGVTAVQLMEAGQQPTRRLHYEVIVRREDVYAHGRSMVPVDASCEQLDEVRAVAVVGKDG